MFQTSMIVISLLLMVTALVARSRRVAAPAPKARKARASAAARAIVKARVDKAAIRQPAAGRTARVEWAEPEASHPAAPQPEDAAARLRDRYIGARFPGMTKGVEGLREIEQVINVARLYFEERKLDRAHELLGLAVAETPGDQSLRLAQLEIAFLGGEAALFTEVAHEFHAAMPGSPEWAEVCRLGRALSPGQPLFGAAPDAPAHAHYGPWPDTPNWIHASWDLTGEVLAADFHRALAHRNDEARAHPLRRVA
jgi:Tfp pilus assembly protein FimV